MKVSSQLPVVAPRKAPKLVAIGDSLTAGMQDCNLVGSRQEHSYPNLIAKQGGFVFKQPLLKENGIPPKLFMSPDASLMKAAWRYTLVGLAHTAPMAATALGINPPEWLYTGIYHAGGMGQRVEKGEVQNFAIPGLEARHLNNIHSVKDFGHEVVMGIENKGAMLAEIPFIRQITQGGRSACHGVSQVDAAVAQKPDMVMLWAGNNDALAGALSGEVNDLSLTPMEDRPWKMEKKKWPWSKPSEVETPEVIPGFRSTMNEAVGRLLKETDAEIMLMNIPDVTVIPHLFRLGEKVGPLPFRMVLPGGADVTEKIANWKLPTKINGKGKGGRLYFPEGTRVGLAQILKKLTHYYKVKTEKDLDAALMAMTRSGGVFTEKEAVDPEEAATIQKRVSEYNALLKEFDEKNPRVHLVDVNGCLNRAARQGIPLRGEGEAVTVTNTFTGSQDRRGYQGMFSFDGIHPSDVGYAVIANEIIDKARVDLKDDPRFTTLVNSQPVDEKAALNGDPHRSPGHMLLNGFVSEQLNASS
ncbi:SGNH/GDSL hydrolase family protein [bacterium]|nr:SGNH/GDSL hydrolase family protein [bacterium]